MTATFPLTAAAFPDFDLSTMPETIPAGFVESSFKNDACPSFWNEAAGLQIFVDYADIDAREFPGSPRFHVVDSVNGDSLISANDWVELTGKVAEIMAGVTVTDEATAKAFLTDLHARGLAYHPDDRASDCLSFHKLPVEKLQAIQINMRATFDHLDPSEFLLVLINA